MSIKDDTPMIIAHGTSVEHLRYIAQHGLRPRGGRGINNWKHTVGSNAKAVYLTTAYAAYFAYTSTETHDYALIEVRHDKLDLRCMQADEDAVEQSMRAHPDKEDPRIKGWDMKRRTIWYRARAHQYSWALSLKALGTCAHRGDIAPSSLGRVVIIEREAMLDLILRRNLDPFISTISFHHLGEQYVQAQRWLFGDERDLLKAPGTGPVAVLPGITLHASLADALERSVA